MANIKGALLKGLKGAQRVGNAIGPYVLGNIGAAAAMHSGIDHVDQLKDMPGYLESGFLYGGLTAFNAGVLVPFVENPVKYAHSLVGRAEGNIRDVSLHPNIKSTLLLGALALGLGNGSIRDSSTSALEHIADDVSSVFHYEKTIEAPKPSVILPQPEVDLGDPQLESDITAYVNGLREKGLARKRGIEDYSLFAKDLHDGSVVVDINTHVPRLAASTNKVYVLLAAEKLVEDGKLEYTVQLRRNLEAMIARSNNHSTDWVIDQVGGETALNQIVHDYGFTDTTLEKIRPKETGGRTLGNKTSAQDLGTFFEGVYAGTFPRSDDMRRILSIHSAGHPDRIVDRTCIPDDPKFLTKNGGYVEDVEDKTGFIWGANNDAGIVFAHFYNKAEDITTEVPYIVTFLVEDQAAKPDRFRGTDKAWGRAKSETLRTISENIFWNGFQTKYSDISPSCKAHKGRHPQ